MIFPAFSKIVSRIGYPDLSFPLPETTGPPAAPKPIPAQMTREKSSAGRCLNARWCRVPDRARLRSEEHTSELQSLMRISYAVFCLKKKKTPKNKEEKQEANNKQSMQSVDEIYNTQ